jgi:hypothetical protein
MRLRRPSGQLPKCYQFIRAHVEQLFGERYQPEAGMLGRMIAWRIQEKFYGGHTRPHSDLEHDIAEVCHRSRGNAVPGGGSQREKVPAGGASGQRLRNPDPFIDFNPRGVEAVFTPAQVNELMAVISNLRSTLPLRAMLRRHVGELALT